MKPRMNDEQRMIWVENLPVSFPQFWKTKEEKKEFVKANREVIDDLIYEILYPPRG